MRKKSIFIATFACALYLQTQLYGGYATEFTQILNYAELTKQVGLQKEQVEQLIQQYKALEEQTRQVKVLHRQLTSVPSDWEAGSLMAYHHSLTHAMDKIKGLTWSDDDNEERLEAVYPIWEATHEDDFKEEYLERSNYLREATAVIMDNLHDNYEQQMEYAKRAEDINERVNEAEGQTAVMQANAEMLMQINMQLVALNNAINNQTTLLANQISYDESKESQARANLSASIPQWGGNPNPLYASKR